MRRRMRGLDDLQFDLHVRDFRAPGAATKMEEIPVSLRRVAWQS
jgi:hypothetical protein